jgi:spermidine synthase
VRKQTPKSPSAHAPVPTAYLLASLFLSGASSLVLEIAGSRLISPFYGSSIYTWSALITVTMVALALGYAWGGRLSDRHPHLTLFARLLTGAGLTLAAVPWLRAPALKASLPLGVQAGALASAAALIGPTLVLLGALGPAAVRLTATGAADSGRRSGDAWAVSTAGSVLGAFLAGFVLIPSFPISRVLLGTALLLLALGAWGSWLSTRALPLGQLAACAACGLLALRPAAPSRFALSAVESAYGRVVVMDTPAKRFLLVNGTSQSVMDKDGGESESQYVRALEWTRALRPKARSALVVGLGAGLLPKALERRGLVADAYEIDPAIAGAARAWFDYAPKGEVSIGDGRAALERSERSWDLAFLDAFGAESPPSHLFTAEFFLIVRERLAPGGVLAVNLVTSVDRRDAAAWTSVHKTLTTVFPSVRAFVASEPSEGLANVLLFASTGPLEAGPPPAPESARREVALMLSRELKPSPADLSAATLLHDDHAPLEFLLAGTARRWRRMLQESMSEVLLD